MKTTQSETTKALGNANVKAAEGNKFSAQVRQIGLNTIQDGDIITIPSDYTVLEQTIKGSDAPAQYIFVNIKRGNRDMVAQFYPSLFWKSRREVDETGHYTGVWQNASGEVVDFVQNYDDADEAVKAVAQHGSFLVKLSKPFSILRFGQDEGGATQKATVPTITWAVA